MPAERPLQPDVTANRKLIRPTLSRLEPNFNHGPVSMERRERPSPAAAKKPAPLDQTNAENFYYQKQMQGKTPMVVVLRDGELMHGVIEWYDRYCIKLNRDGQPNVMIYKPAIKYMYKEGEAG